jgi:NitT/TauT family transport system substrate-binding protein
VAIFAVLAMHVAACGGDDAARDPATEGAATSDGGAETTQAMTDDTEAMTDDTEAMTDDTEAMTGDMTSVSLQLQWFPQAQFAGYYAAVEQGFYEARGLDVEILAGAVDIVPQQVVATGGAEFGISWVPKALVSNAEGAGLVNVGQVFQRSGTLMVSWADAGITSPEDWAGKTVGNWGFGNEYELTAAIEQAGIADDVELVSQNFDMEGLLNRELDAAEAMIYNEYAQVLETVNEDTGELYQPDDLTVIDFNDIGTAMLQDAIWVTEDYAANQGETVTAFLEASFEGWIFCRDNPDDCVQYVLDAGSTLPAGHQAWMMNEINALIWPSAAGIGVMDESLWQQTVEVATSQIPELQGVDIPETSYTTEFAETAVAALNDAGLDTVGDGFQKADIALTEGGE